MSEAGIDPAPITSGGTNDLSVSGNHQMGEEHEIISWLSQRIIALFKQVEQQEFWTVLNSPLSDRGFVRAIMREQYLQIVGYQPDAIEGAIAAIGQMPRSMNPRLIQSMLIHQADEWDHGEMAMRDFLGLAESEGQNLPPRMSVEAYAVAAVWRMIAHKREPFCYLGALYLFEGLTPMVTGMIKANLRLKGLEDSSLEYIEFHSTEDIKHAKLVNHLISTIAHQFPESVDAMKYGYECFEHVYPLPVWRAAYERARECYVA